MPSQNRLSPDEKDALRLTVAELYCERGMQQSQIVHEIKRIHNIETSAMQVSRLLKEAKDRGLVRFVYTPPMINGVQTELMARFPCLKEALVIATGSDFEFQLQMLGQAGANYFDKIVAARPGIKVGISGGNTIYAMIDSLPKRERDFIGYPTALIGRGPMIPEHVDPMVLLSVLREKSGSIARCFYTTLLPFEKNTDLRRVREENDRLKRTHQKVREVWSGMQNVDIIFASVGALNPDEIYLQKRGRTLLNLLADLTVSHATLEKAGAVGDISYSLFDKDGRTRHPEWDFFVTLGVDFIRRMAASHPAKRVVLIAGQHKLKALFAALRGRLASVLITDSTTAAQLIELADNA